MTDTNTIVRVPRGSVDERESRDSRDARDGRPQRKSFHAEVVVHLDFDLANYLGNFILDQQCNNPALLALAHQLVGDC